MEPASAASGPLPLLVGLATAVIAVEAIVAVVLARRDGGPWSRIAGRLLPTLAAGGFLMLALGAAARDLDWRWAAVALTGAGVAHAVDLRRRWRDERVSRARGTGAAGSDPPPPDGSARRP